jgi:dihydrofolate reductase
MTADAADADYETTENMFVFGGNFVQALALAFRFADPHNQARLKDAFPEYFQKYADPQWRRRRARE